MSNIEQHYKVLGLCPGASPPEIKQAYLQLAKLWHPDRFPDEPQRQQEAEEKIKEINGAYQFLKECSFSTQASETKRNPSAACAPATVVARKTSSETFYNRGVELANREAYEAAIAEFTLAIRFDPSYVEAYEYRGSIRLILGYEYQAASDRSKARELKQAKQKQASPPSANAKPPIAVTPPTPSVDKESVGVKPSPSIPPPSPELPWKCVQVLEEPNSKIAAIALNRAGKILIAGLEDGAIILWNLQTGKQFGGLVGHSAAVFSLALSLDGQILISGSADCTLKIWHLGAGSLLRTLIGHREAVQTVLISPDRQTLISGSADHSIKLWSASTGKFIGLRDRHRAAIRVMTLSMDGRHLVSSSDDRTVALWTAQLTSLGQALTCYASISFETAVGAIAISPDGRVLVTGSDDGIIKLWELQSGKLIATLIGHTSAVSALAINSAGSMLVSGSSDQTVKLWNLSTTELLGTLASNDGECTSVIFSPDNRTLITRSNYQTIRIWKHSS